MPRWLPNLTGRSAVELETKAAADRRASQGPFYTAKGLPYTSNWDIDRIVRDGYEKVIWVFKAIDANAEKLSSWPIKCYDGSKDDPDRKLLTDADEPVLALLNNRANMIDGPAKYFRYRVYSQLILSKKGVFVEVIPTKGGQLGALNLLPPGRTDPIPDPDKFLGGFRVTLGDGEVFDLPVYDPKKRRGVLWIRKPHPTNPYSSVTPLEAAGISIDLDFYARLYNRNFLLNDGRAGQIVAVKGGLSDEDALELKARFSPGMGGVGRTTVIEADAINVQDTAVSPRDAQYAELRSITKEDLLIALGTPESVIGNASGRTFDNADAEKENWLEDTVVPLGGVFEAGCEPLTTGGYDDDRFLEHDTSRESVLQRIKMREQDKARADFEAGNITHAELRHKLELDPFDGPGTDVIWLNVNGKAPTASDVNAKAAAEELKVLQPEQPAAPDGMAPPDGGDPADPNAPDLFGGGGSAADAGGDPSLDPTQGAAPAQLADRNDPFSNAAGLSGYGWKDFSYTLELKSDWADDDQVEPFEVKAKPNASNMSTHPASFSWDENKVKRDAKGRFAHVAAKGLAHILDFPDAYPFAKVEGAPPATPLPAKKKIKLGSLRKGDVIAEHDAKGSPLWTVASIGKPKTPPQVGEPNGAQVLVQLVNVDGEKKSLIAANKNVGVFIVARTPHPALVAQAKKDKATGAVVTPGPHIVGVKAAGVQFGDILVDAKGQQWTVTNVVPNPNHTVTLSGKQDVETPGDEVQLGVFADTATLTLKTTPELAAAGVAAEPVTGESSTWGTKNPSPYAGAYKDAVTGNVLKVGGAGYGTWYKPDGNPLEVPSITPDKIADVVATITDAGAKHDGNLDAFDPTVPPDAPTVATYQHADGTKLEVHPDGTGTFFYANGTDAPAPAGTVSVIVGGTALWSKVAAPPPKGMTGLDVGHGNAVYFHPQHDDVWTRTEDGAITQVWIKHHDGTGEWWGYSAPTVGGGEQVGAPGDVWTQHVMSEFAYQGEIWEQLDSGSMSGVEKVWSAGSAEKVAPEANAADVVGDWTLAGGKVTVHDDGTVETSSSIFGPLSKFAKGAIEKLKAGEGTKLEAPKGLKPGRYVHSSGKILTVHDDGSATIVGAKGNTHELGMLEAIKELEQPGWTAATPSEPAVFGDGAPVGIYGKPGVEGKMAIFPDNNWALVKPSGAVGPLHQFGPGDSNEAWTYEGPLPPDILDADKLAAIAKYANEKGGPNPALAAGTLKSVKSGTFTHPALGTLVYDADTAVGTLTQPNGSREPVNHATAASLILGSFGTGSVFTPAGGQAPPSAKIEPGQVWKGNVIGSDPDTGEDGVTVGEWKLTVKPDGSGLVEYEDGATPEDVDATAVNAMITDPQTEAEVVSTGAPAKAADVPDAGKLNQMGLKPSDVGAWYSEASDKTIIVYNDGSIGEVPGKFGDPDSQLGDPDIYAYGSDTAFALVDDLKELTEYQKLGDEPTVAGPLSTGATKKTSALHLGDTIEVAGVPVTVTSIQTPSIHPEAGVKVYGKPVLLGGVPGPDVNPDDKDAYGGFLVAVAHPEFEFPTYASSSVDLSMFEPLEQPQKLSETYDGGTWVGPNGETLTIDAGVAHLTDNEGSEGYADQATVDAFVGGDVIKTHAGNGVKVGTWVNEGDNAKLVVYPSGDADLYEFPGEEMPAWDAAIPPGTIATTIPADHVGNYIPDLSFVDESAPGYSADAPADMWTANDVAGAKVNDVFWQTYTDGSVSKYVVTAQGVKKWDWSQYEWATGAKGHVAAGGPFQPENYVKPLGSNPPIKTPYPPPMPGVEVYKHPQGKVIYVFPNGNLEAWGPDGKKKQTSATADNLKWGHGAWVKTDHIAGWQYDEASNEWKSDQAGGPATKAVMNTPSVAPVDVGDVAKVFVTNPSMGGTQNTLTLHPDGSSTYYDGTDKTSDHINAGQTASLLSPQSTGTAVWIPSPQQYYQDTWGNELQVEADGSGTIVYANNSSDPITLEVDDVMKLVQMPGWKAKPVSSSAPTHVPQTGVGDFNQQANVPLDVKDLLTQEQKDLLAVIDYPDDYPWPQVPGVPPASKVEAGSKVKPISLRNGDVVDSDAPTLVGKGPLTVTKTKKQMTGTGGSTWHIWGVASDGTTHDFFVGDFEQVPVLARTPHPSKVAAAKKLKKSLEDAPPAPAAVGPQTGFAATGPVLSEKAKAAAKAKYPYSATVAKGGTILLPDGGSMVVTGAKWEQAHTSKGGTYRPGGYVVTGIPSADINPKYLTGDNEAKLYMESGYGHTVQWIPKSALKGKGATMPAAPGSSINPPAPPAPDVMHPTGDPGLLSTSGWKKVGPQAGSNPGGQFQAPSGETYYVKAPQSPTHAENEKLAARLYTSAGIQIPQVELAAIAPELGLSGKSELGIASRLVAGKKNLPTAYKDPSYRAAIVDGFAVDAWLGNWDAVGTGKDNIIQLENGNPLRVDVGGSLLFRAQGTPKGNDFGPKVTETKTLLDASKNPDSAAVYGNVTKAELKASVQKHIAPISEPQIDTLVEATMKSMSPDDREHLKALLKARRKDIAKQAGVVLPEDQPVNVDEVNVPTSVKLPYKAGAVGSEQVTLGGKDLWWHTQTVPASQVPIGSAIFLQDDPTTPYVVTKMAPKVTGALTPKGPATDAGANKMGVWGKKNGTGEEMFLFVQVPSSGERQVEVQSQPAPGWKPPPPPPPPTPGVKLDVSGVILKDPLDASVSQQAEKAKSVFSGLWHKLIPGAKATGDTKNANREQSAHNAWKLLTAEQHQILASEGFDSESKFVAKIVQVANAWDGNSNDSSVLQLSFQHAIAIEFGMDDVAPWGQEQKSMKLKTDVASEFAKNGAAYQVMARAVYQNTQNELKARGVKYVYVSRKFSFSPPDGGHGGTPAPPWAWASGVHDDVTNRPINSTAWNPNVWNGNVQIEAYVPVESIFSTGPLGPGGLSISESEIVILGVPIRWKVSSHGAKPGPGYTKEKYLQDYPEWKPGTSTLQKSWLDGAQPRVTPYPNDETEDWLKGAYWPYTDEDGDDITTVAEMLDLFPAVVPWVLLDLPVGKAMPQQLRNELLAMPIDEDEIGPFASDYLPREMQQPNRIYGEGVAESKAWVGL